MRLWISVAIALMAAALGVCAVASARTGKTVAPKVTKLLIGTIPPVIGSFLTIISHSEYLSGAGVYINMIGMDIMMFYVLDFALYYCGTQWKQGMRLGATLLLAADMLQIACNPITGHVFWLSETTAHGALYYDALSMPGSVLHLGIDYFFFVVVLLIFTIALMRAPLIYAERYAIIIVALAITGVWEAFYIYSREPVNISVIGYAVFGYLVFYFSLYYRPMRVLDHMLANIASGLTSALYFFDINERCLWADQHGSQMVKLTDEDFIDCTNRLIALFPGLELDKNGWKCHRELEQDQGKRYYMLEKHTVMDAKGRTVGSVLSIQDETEQQLSFQREHYAATHDRLTGMPTKEYLYQLVRERLDQNPDDDFYIAYLDINNFKMINDSLGRDFGDFALRSLAVSLKENLPATAIAGRLTGDCFGCCLNAQEYDPDRAEQMMDSFCVDAETFTYRMVIHEGIYHVTDRSMEVSVMFDRAHMALSTIKGEYKRHLAVYDDKLRESALWDQEIVNHLPEALAEGQIRPYLQAIVDTTGTVIGAEALVRWIHPEKGFLPPGVFIPAIETNGMIADVDRHIWRSSCQVLKRWQELGRGDLFISVNISPKDYLFMDVPRELSAIVQEFGIDSKRLRVEITESIMINEQANRTRMIQELQEAGFIVEMDDFGSGYSSLNMLKDMPVDIVKVDMVFLAKVKDIKRATTILRNVMNMTNELGIVPLTEGVETVEQFEMLRDMGCKLFQGYYFSKPIPVEEYESSFLGLS